MSPHEAAVSGRLVGRLHPLPDPRPFRGLRSPRPDRQVLFAQLVHERLPQRRPAVGQHSRACGELVTDAQVRSPQLLIWINTGTSSIAASVSP